jgi:hypothetical protein
MADGENVVGTALGAVKDLVDSHVEDYSTGIADGTYDDKAGLTAAEQTSKTFDRMIPALASAYDAAKALLDAFGGNTPDWLRDEAIALEEALSAINAAAGLEAQPAAAPGP